jgi:hypothetical protein
MTEKYVAKQFKIEVGLAPKATMARASVTPHWSKHAKGK